jgi:hypothetical protein
MQLAKAPFKLTPSRPRPQTRRKPATRHRVTRDELAALENSARECARYGEHLAVLLETIPPIGCKTELRVIQMIGERAGAALQKSGGAS